MSRGNEITYPQGLSDDALVSSAKRNKPSRSAEKQSRRCFAALFISMFLNFVLAILHQAGVGLNTQIVTVVQIFITLACGVLVFFKSPRINQMALVALLFMVLMLVVTNLATTPNPRTFYDCLIIPLYIAIGSSARQVNTKYMNILFFAVVAIALVELLAPDLYTAVVNPGSFFTATREWVADQKANDALKDGLYTGAYRGGGSVFALGDHRISGPFLEPLSLGYFSVLMTIYFAGMHRGSLLYRTIAIAGCLWISLLSDSRAASGIIVLSAPLLVLKPRFPEIVVWLTAPAILSAAWLLYVLAPAFLVDDMFSRISVTFSGLEQVGVIQYIIGDTPTIGMNDSGVLYMLRCFGILGILPAVWWFGGAFTRSKTSQPIIFVVAAIYVTTTLLFGGALFSIKTASLLGFLLGVAGSDERERSGSYVAK